MSGPSWSSGTPTLKLSDGGTASYDAAKSSATSLVFDYTVGSSDGNVSSLQVNFQMSRFDNLR
jgi:hypothetical protein